MASYEYRNLPRCVTTALLNASVINASVNSSLEDMRGYDMASIHVTTNGVMNHAGTLTIVRSGAASGLVHINMAAPMMAIVNATNNRGVLEVVDVADPYIGLHYYSATGGNEADTMTAVITKKMRGNS